MINSLTSMRMFFALCVFLSHLSFLNDSKQYSEIFDSVFYEGFLGVSFFFILSGFILSYSYGNRLEKQEVSKRAFYVARLARIYPIHCVTLIIAILLGLLSSSGAKYILPNLLLIQSFSNNSSIFFSLNAPAWSISDEMFFYLLFPVIILLKIQHKVLVFSMLVIVIIYLNIALLEDNKHYWLYISPIIRFADFLLGMILYQIFVMIKNTKYQYLSMISLSVLELFTIFIFVLFFYFHNEIPISYRYAAYYWAPMVLIILVFSLIGSWRNKGIITHILSMRFFVWLGEISFCFYLFHLLIIRVLNYLRIKYEWNIDLLYFSGIIFFLTIIVSAIAYHCIEKPMNKRIKSWLS